MRKGFRGHYRFGIKKPATPTNLQANPSTTSSISLSWTDNSSNETGFQIREVTSFFPVATYAVIATVGPGVTTYEVTGLNEGEGHYYQVRAVNLSVYSSDSNLAFALTYFQDSLDYFTAASISGQTEKTAYNNFVYQNSQGTMYSNLVRFWPMSPTSNAAARRCSISLTQFEENINMPTHDATGYVFDGTKYHIVDDETSQLAAFDPNSPLGFGAYLYDNPTPQEADIMGVTDEGSVGFGDCVIRQDGFDQFRGYLQTVPTTYEMVTSAFADLRGVITIYSSAGQGTQYLQYYGPGGDETKEPDTTPPDIEILPDFKIYIGGSNGIDAGFGDNFQNGWEGTIGCAFIHKEPDPEQIYFFIQYINELMTSYGRELT